ncbi:MAG: alkaline phosphatase family protein [Peptococcaceae bacterium]|nr:alkaline phosphatase family protein [Peptococcaceae bacterium]
MSEQKKLFVLGIDGMDPRLTCKYVEEGIMPNTKAFIERGSARKDLVMLGGHPTVTPPMWTTLATGAYPITHGIVGFSIPDPINIGESNYALDSNLCKAEQLWNVTAEAGLKTLVFHWPGSSWPPTSDSPNLHVVDGTQPAAPNMGVAQVESEFILVASDKTEHVLYRRKAATDTNVPCVITDLNVTDESFNVVEGVSDGASKMHVILSERESQNGMSDAPFDVVLSPIAPAKNWANAPADAKEFTLLFSGGLIRRVGLILKNDDGIYDHIALYRSKKDETPYATLKNDVFTPEIIDEAIKNDVRYDVNRNMRVVDLAEDGNYLKLWISAAMDLHNDSVWHPKSLYKQVTEKVGYPSPEALLGGGDEILIRDCMRANWDYMADWEAGALNTLIEENKYDVVFSHFHNIDGQGHMILKFLKDKGRSKLSEETYAQLLREVYIQTDEYIGKFMHLLDEDWTIFIVSDHAQVCPEHLPPLLGDGCGVDLRVMEELGYTHVKKDADGNDTHEIDWSRTKAVARGLNIFLNIKGRNPHGIIDPKDQYEEEERLMTALYGYRSPETGNRVVALALRNKDCIQLGLGGPNCGDIMIWLAEGYNYDHNDSLSSTYGYGHTSVSPIFIAAGPGIKKHYTTDRIIREADLTPTMAELAGVRMPKQCEGAPIYQIME